MTTCDDAGTSKVQRFEVFTGAGHRRDGPQEVKAAIIAESYSKQETVCADARRHGLSPSACRHNVASSGALSQSPALMKWCSRS